MPEGERGPESRARALIDEAHAADPSRLPDGTACDVIAKPYQMSELAVKTLTHLTAPS